jgi:hypothetical protein
VTGARRYVLPAAACVALAALVWAVYGEGNIGYDTYYALIWGDQLSEGTLPTYEAFRSPTPHPLSNFVGLLLVPLGDGAEEAMTVITLLAFAGLAYAAFELGRALVAWPVGVVFAAVLLTRPLLVEQALSTSIDVPFLALVVGAAAVEVRRPGRWLPVLVLLGVAGLLRPEAWGLSAAYVVYAWRLLRPGERGRMIATAAAAPVAWMVSDLIITGSPKWSFDQARATAERNGTPGGVEETIVFTGKALKGVVHPAFAAGAAFGVLLAIRYFGRRALVPLAALALGAASFLVIGFSGLPLLTRYFFLAGTMLCLFFAVAIAGWSGVERSDPVRRWWIAGAAVLALVIVATLRYEYKSIDGRLREANRRGEVQHDLERMIDQGAFRSAIATCKPLYSRVFRARPKILFERRDEPGIEVVANQRLVPQDGLLLRYVYERTPAPTGYRTVTATRLWSLLATCRARARYPGRSG